MLGLTRHGRKSNGHIGAALPINPWNGSESKCASVSQYKATKVCPESNGYVDLCLFPNFRYLIRVIGRKGNKWDDEDGGDYDVDDDWDYEEDVQVKPKVKAQASAPPTKKKPEPKSKPSNRNLPTPAKATNDKDNTEYLTPAQRRKLEREREVEADLLHASDLLGPSTSSDSGMCHCSFWPSNHSNLDSPT